MRRLIGVLSSVVGLALVTSSSASAQQQLPPPAPAPPPGQYQPPPGQYPQYQQPQYQQPPPGQYPQYQQPPPGQYPPPQYGQPQYGQPYGQPQYGQPQYQYPPAQPQYQPRPAPAPQPAPVEPLDPPTHAPKFSLYAGARLSYLGFGFSFYTNRQGESETTGNFIGNGLAPELDLGARLGHRYIPYVFFEHGFMGAGHRFEGSNASGTTDYYGIGFRHVSGDVDSVGFLTDIAIGKRVISVSNDGDTYSMSGLEWFRLGLGAEIRITTLFALTPMLTIATGQLNDSEGNVRFSSEGSQDGNTEPAFKNGEVIKNANNYVVLSLGVGGHFDIFGK